MKVDLHPENKYGSRDIHFKDVKSKFSTFSFQNLSILLIESFSFWILALISRLKQIQKVAALEAYSSSNWEFKISQQDRIIITPDE